MFKCAEYSGNALVCFRFQTSLWYVLRNSSFFHISYREGFVDVWQFACISYQYNQLL